MKMLSISSTFG